MKPGIGASLLLAAWLAAAPAMAGDWEVMESGSRIGFVATYEDTPFNAWFRSFDARISFDPDALDEASFDIRIDVSSVDSSSRDRDEGMKQEEWLAAGEHPEARFLAEHFERISEQRFKAIGQLAVKDVRRTVEVPFRWQQSGDRAELTAETEVQRGQFGIGTGDWAGDDTIGFTVTIRARLDLARR